MLLLPPLCLPLFLYHSAFSSVLCPFLSLPLFPSLLLSLTPNYLKQRYRLKFSKGFLWSTVPEGKGDLTGTGWNKWQADSACEPSHSQMDTDKGIKRIMEAYSTTTVVQQCGIWESRHHDCCCPQNASIFVWLARKLPEVISWHV